MEQSGFCLRPTRPVRPSHCTLLARLTTAASKRPPHPTQSRRHLKQLGRGLKPPTAVKRSSASLQRSIHLPYTPFGSYRRTHLIVTTQPRRHLIGLGPNPTRLPTHASRLTRPHRHLGHNTPRHTTQRPLTASHPQLHSLINLLS